jgi:hypothetical protein
MFETLEDKFEKSKPPLDRGLPILLYSFYAVFSSIALILGVGRHGFSRLFSLVVWAAMFLLSLTWLMTSLKSSVPNTRRDFWVRSMILLWLLIAQRLPYLLR